MPTFFNKALISALIYSSISLTFLKLICYIYLLSNSSNNWWFYYFMWSFIYFTFFSFKSLKSRLNLSWETCTLSKIIFRFSIISWLGSFLEFFTFDISSCNRSWKYYKFSTGTISSSYFLFFPLNKIIARSITLLSVISTELNIFFNSIFTLNSFYFLLNTFYFYFCSFIDDKNSFKRF